MSGFGVDPVCGYVRKIRLDQCVRIFFGFGAVKIGVTAVGTSAIQSMLRPPTGLPAPKEKNFHSRTVEVNVVDQPGTSWILQDYLLPRGSLLVNHNQMSFILVSVFLVFQPSSLFIA